MVAFKPLEGLGRLSQFVGNPIHFRVSPYPGGVASGQYFGKENGKVKAGAKWNFHHNYLRNLPRNQIWGFYGWFKSDVCVLRNGEWKANEISR